MFIETRDQVNLWFVTLKQFGRTSMKIDRMFIILRQIIKYYISKNKLNLL